MSSRKLVVLGPMLALVCFAGGPLTPYSSPLQSHAAAGTATAGDPLPSKDALKRFGTVRFRTGDGILSLAYSADGKYLAAGGRDDVVRLFDAQTGQLLRTFKEHWVWTLAFSSDGKYLVTGGTSKVVRVWNVKTGEQVHQMSGHKATIKSLALADKENVIVSGSDDGTMRLWKLSDGSAVKVYEGHIQGVNTVAVSPKVRTLASGSTDRTVRIWKEGNVSVLHTSSAVQAIAYLPDDKSLLTAGDDGFLRVWDIATAKQTRSWQAHPTTITHLVMSHNGKTLVTADADRTVRVWDFTKDSATHTMQRRLGDCDAVALTLDGTVLAAGGTNNTIHRWDVLTGNALPLPAGAAGAVVAMACSTDGKLLATGLTNNQAQLLDLHTGAAVQRLVCGTADAEVLVALTPDAKHLVTVSYPDSVILWRTADGKEKQRLVASKRDEVLCATFSPDGQRLALGCTHGGLQLWDLQAGQIVKQIAMPLGARAVAFAPNGSLLAIGTEDAVVVLDALTYQPVGKYEKLNTTVTCLAFSPDSRHLAAGTFASAIRLFDLKFPKLDKEVEPRLLEGHQGGVHSLAWSNNGRCVVSAGFDKTVRVWEFVNARPLAAWTGHEGAVSAVAFHPAARQIVSASRDTTVMVWDATLLGMTGKLPAVDVLDVPNLDRMWKELASDDNPLGNKALWTMVAGSKESVRYLAKKVFLTDPVAIKQYLMDLDDVSWKKRDRAMSALTGYERWVEGLLKEELAKTTSKEVKERVKVLLKRLERKDAATLHHERLRMRRVIEILEQAATDEAKALLVGLAKGAAEQDLREMAQGALERLEKRG